MSFIKRIVLPVMYLPIIVVMGFVWVINKINQRRCMKGLLGCMSLELIDTFSDQDFFELIRVIFNVIGFKECKELNSTCLFNEQNTIIFSKYKKRFVIKTCVNQSLAINDSLVNDLSKVVSVNTCDYALIISSQNFSDNVCEIAKNKKIELVNRNDLGYLIEEISYKRTRVAVKKFKQGTKKVMINS